MATYSMSRTAIIAIATVLAVGIVAGIAYFLMAGDDGDGDGDGSEWRPGDFVEWGSYDVPLSEQPLYPQYIYRYTIKEVMADKMLINTTTSLQGYVIYSAQGYIQKNVTGFGYSYESMMASPYDVTYIGIDSIEIGDWGTVNAQHYQYVYSYGETVYTVDLWVKNGFILARETKWDSSVELIMIYDTNVEKIFGT
ncbi:MAG: hypothetical protein HPY73_02205 [Methanomassiliicoccales archaeon]|nr:MAG: hypothetical protein HPY73_02205 [Methanomassiliicoccales archaeon]